MPVFVEQYNLHEYVLILSSVYTLCHYCGMVATTAGNKVSNQLTRSRIIWRQLEELQVEDEGSTSLYKQIYSVGFQCLQLIHVLALSPQVTVDSAWVFPEHTKLWNQNSLSYGVWSQGGADYTACQPFSP